jgi:hypothetical protein
MRLEGTPSRWRAQSHLLGTMPASSPSWRILEGFCDVTDSRGRDLGGTCFPLFGFSLPPPLPPPNGA